MKYTSSYTVLLLFSLLQNNDDAALVDKAKVEGVETLRVCFLSLRLCLLGVLVLILRVRRKNMLK